jgi:hypothetical protein
MTKQFTEAEFVAFVQLNWGDDTASVLAQVGRWIARGDGAAVYTNNDLGHPDVGMPKIMSYGSPQAMLETDEPPDRMPDTNVEINWRYGLMGTYRTDKSSGRRNFRIPAVNWSDELASALRDAQPGDKIVVKTEQMRALAQSAAVRMGKTGVTIEISEEGPDHD